MSFVLSNLIKSLIITKLKISSCFYGQIAVAHDVCSKMMSICLGQTGDDDSQARRIQRRKSRLHDFSSIDVEGSPEILTSDEEGTSLLAGIGSGTGILEFSPERAGLDVTPADLDFGDVAAERKSSPPLVLSALAGQTLFTHNQNHNEVSQAAQSRCTVVRPIQKSIGKWEIRPPVKS